MILRRIYSFFSSAKLAIVLLIAILACCLLGVTVWRGAAAGRAIFATLWFNALLVLLMVNVAFCFFPRVAGRKLTLVSVGMTLFHLSFVVMLLAIVFNSLFSFRGTIRLSEGEILPSGDPASYDYFEQGRYFSFSRLKGETQLVKMHANYSIDGRNKLAAYEIKVGEGGSKKQGIMYITRSFEEDGFTYLNDREGYSLILRLTDRDRKELYSVCAPIQSLKQPNGSYLYTTGTRFAPESYPFPQPPADPLFNLQVIYSPSKLRERAGDVYFRITALHEGEKEEKDTLLAEGGSTVGGWFDFGGYRISVAEVRYWVVMNVRYEPGKPIVLASLWVGLGGLVITFIGRLRRGKRQDNRGQITEDR